MGKARLFAVAVAIIALALSVGASGVGADTPTTFDVPVQGTLMGVGPAGRSLIVGYTNIPLPGCGVFGVTPDVSETSTTVTVALTGHVGLLPPGASCPALALMYTTTVPLANPLAGRAVEGLTLEGGAYGPPDFSAPLKMPSLIGLSPLDARLLITRTPSALAGLIDHHTKRAPANSLARIVAQQPLAGAPIERQTYVVLRVAP